MDLQKTNTQPQGKRKSGLTSPTRTSRREEGEVERVRSRVLDGMALGNLIKRLRWGDEMSGIRISAWRVVDGWNTPPLWQELVGLETVMPCFCASGQKHA